MSNMRVLTILLKEMVHRLTARTFIANRSRSFAIDMFVIFSFSLLIIVWLPSGTILAGGDSVYLPERSETFARTFFQWDESNGGVFNPRVSAMSVPYEFFRASSAVLGIGLSESQLLWMILMGFLSGFSMYYLVYNLTSGKENRENPRAGAIVGSLMYMTSTYMAIFILPDFYYYSFYAALPLLIGLFIKGFKDGRSWRFALLICLVWTITTGSASVDPVFPLLIWIVLVFLAIGYLILKTSGINRRTSMRFLLVFLLIWTLTNLYWVLPDLAGSQEALNQVNASYDFVNRQSSREDVWAQTLAMHSAPLSESYRMLGFWALKSGYGGEPYFAWYSIYNNWIMIMIGFAFPILSFGILLSRHRKEETLLFCSLILASLLIMGGSLEPFNRVNSLLFDNVPLMKQFFSQTYLRFAVIIVLAYSYLVGQFVNDILARKSDPTPSTKRKTSAMSGRKLPRVERILAVLVVIALVVSYGIPVISGEAFGSQGKLLKSTVVEYPSYYSEAREWLDRYPEEFRILSVPYSMLSYRAFEWDRGFNGPDPTSRLLGRDVIQGMIGLGNIALQMILNVESNNTQNVAETLSIMNVRFVLLHLDANEGYMNKSAWYILSNITHAERILNGIPHLSFVGTFGKLKLFENELWKPATIYLSQGLTLIDRSVADAENYDLDRGNVAYLSQYSVSESSFSLNPIRIDTIGDLRYADLSSRQVFFRDLTAEDFSVVDGKNVSFFLPRMDLLRSAEVWVSLPRTLEKVNLGLFVGDRLISEVSADNDIFSEKWIKLGTIKPSDQGITILANTNSVVPTQICLCDERIDGATETMPKLAPEIIYRLGSSPVVAARYFDGWKQIISTNGFGSKDTLVFSSPTSCPYVDYFPPASPSSWFSLNSTIIYLRTGLSYLRIDSISTNGTIAPTIVGAWWETGSSWSSQHLFMFPLFIPPNQKVAIQIPEYAKLIQLNTNLGNINVPTLNGRSYPVDFDEMTPREIDDKLYVPSGYSTSLKLAVDSRCDLFDSLVHIDSSNYSFESYDSHDQLNFSIDNYPFVTNSLDFGIKPVALYARNLEGTEEPFSWDNLSSGSIESRYYSGWKTVIRTDGVASLDAITFDSLVECPYSFPEPSPSGWSSYYSTLVFIKTGNHSLNIETVSSDGNGTSIDGVWWSTDWMGMSTKPVTFPITLPPNDKAIIQIQGNPAVVILGESNPVGCLSSIVLRVFDPFAVRDKGRDTTGAIEWQKNSPVEYEVQLNSTMDSVLVFPSSYDDGWEAFYLDSNKTLKQLHHLRVNDQENGWIVPVNGSIAITIRFTKQNVFNFSGAISLCSGIVLCTWAVHSSRRRRI